MLFGLVCKMECSVAVRQNLLRPNAADVDHYQSKCANTRRACSVAVLDAISPQAYKGGHATQLGVHEVVQQKEQLHL